LQRSLLLTSVSAQCGEQGVQFGKAWLRVALFPSSTVVQSEAHAESPRLSYACLRWFSCSRKRLQLTPLQRSLLKMSHFSAKRHTFLRNPPFPRSVCYTPNQGIPVRFGYDTLILKDSFQKGKHTMYLRPVSLSILALLGLVALSPVQAQVSAAPSLMNFQGRLAKPDGTPVANGTYSVRFSL
jgi:hypothetical protein